MPTHLDADSLLLQLQNEKKSSKRLQTLRRTVTGIQKHLSIKSFYLLVALPSHRMSLFQREGPESNRTQKRQAPRIQNRQFAWQGGRSGGRRGSLTPQIGGPRPEHTLPGTQADERGSLAPDCLLLQHCYHPQLHSWAQDCQEILLALRGGPLDTGVFQGMSCLTGKEAGTH